MSLFLFVWTLFLFYEFGADAGAGAVKHLNQVDFYMSIDSDLDISGPFIYIINNSSNDKWHNDGIAQWNILSSFGMQLFSGQPADELFCFFFYLVARKFIGMKNGS